MHRLSRSLAFIQIVVCLVQVACAQQPPLTDPQLPNERDVLRIENFLASDSLKGRKTFSPEIERASSFIENEFKTAGLIPYRGTSYRQNFFLYTFTPAKSSLTLNGALIPHSEFSIESGPEHMLYKSLDSFTVITISAKDNPGQILSKYLADRSPKTKLLILLDTAYKRVFSRLKDRSNATLTPAAGTVIYVVTTEKPRTFLVRSENRFIKKPLNNVAGLLPGHGKPNEFVLFSAHYDHLGTGRSASANRQPVKGQDSIFNGANDDASGTTAVIELAHYFGKKRNNVRSLLFVMFTAEEIGEYGSKFFALSAPNDSIKAMFNIEMIGTPSKWGNNSGYITGYERSDFGKIIDTNLTGTGFKFYPDPYLNENLFYRSDNAQLARKGVPAHTLSTSKMDHEPNYHTPQDEVSTLDITNMTRIIDAIAIGSRTIVSGKETPTRITTSAVGGN